MEDVTLVKVEATSSDGALVEVFVVLATLVIDSDLAMQTIQGYNDSNEPVTLERLTDALETPGADADVLSGWRLKATV